MVPETVCTNMLRLQLKATHKVSTNTLFDYYSTIHDINIFKNLDVME